MDIVHHSLIGGAGLAIAASANEPILGVAFLIGNIFPDLDVIFMIFGKRFYLKNHQAISHSVILAPLYALVITLCLVAILPDPVSWGIFFAALSGLLLHVFLDWCNTFRIALFSPFYKNRFSLDAVFFIDTFLLFLTAAFYYAYLQLNIVMVAYLYPLIFLTYLGFKFLLQRYVIRKMHAEYAIPGSFNPFSFFILKDTGEGAVSFLYNSLTGKEAKHEKYRPVDKRYCLLAEKSQVYRDMRMISRALTIVDARECDNGNVIIEAADIAIRNFGGHFARTVMTFDKEGQVISEVANI